MIPSLPPPRKPSPACQPTIASGSSSAASPPFSSAASTRSAAPAEPGRSVSPITRPHPANPMSTKTESPTDNPPADLKALLREAEKALGSTSGEAGQKFDELRDRLRAALSND